MSTYLARGHHHTTTGKDVSEESMSGLRRYPPDSIERIRSKTSTNGDTPAEEEGCKEGSLESTNKDDGLKGVVHTEAKAQGSVSIEISADVTGPRRLLTRDHGRR